jgi:6,7-dimethyl-8-ribityllumazine synthase
MKQRVLIVEARFYSEIADDMAKGAIAFLKEKGIDYERMAVPGVFEVPAALNFVIQAMKVNIKTNQYSGFVTLGAVIRGETDHYEHICREASHALMNISVQQSVAIGFGILTCENKEQAKERADVNRGNKGAAAAKACLRMMELNKKLRMTDE